MIGVQLTKMKNLGLSMELSDELIKCLQDRYWRLNNLYYIKDKSGNKIPFKLNWAQEDFYWAMHYFNLVLKARACALS